MDNQNGMMYMPVAPAYGNYGGGNGLGGMFGGDLWGFIILLALLGGFGNFGGNRSNGGNDLLPYMMMNNANTGASYNCANDVQRGFDQAAIIGGINGVQAAVSGGFAGAEIGAANRQAAIMNGFSNLQNQQAQCCCDTRAAIADLKYTVANEGCADRNALSIATRDIMENDNRNHQAVMDKLCQLELDGYKQRLDAANNTIGQLRTELAVAHDREYTNNQTAALQQGQRALANEIEQYVNPTPRPAYIVQNPNCCAPQNPCCNGWAA